jgi:hypothetical protein
LSAYSIMEPEEPRLKLTGWSTKSRSIIGLERPGLEAKYGDKRNTSRVATPNHSTSAALPAAPEAGDEFIAENGGAPGVRLR